RARPALGSHRPDGGGGAASRPGFRIGRGRPLGAVPRGQAAGPHVAHARPRGLTATPSSRLRLRPDRELVAARIAEVEAPPAGEAEGLFHDATAGLLDLRHRVIERPRVEDHQGTARANVFILAKAPDFPTRPLD